MILGAVLDILVQLSDLTLEKVSISVYVFQALVSPSDKRTMLALPLFRGYRRAQMSDTQETWSVALLGSGGVWRCVSFTHYPKRMLRQQHLIMHH